jgi:hypothetical protein
VHPRDVRANARAHRIPAEETDRRLASSGLLARALERLE